MSKQTPVLAWHFLLADKRLRYDDGRLVRTGRSLSVLDPQRPITLCEYGMHASIRPSDALACAPTQAVIICRVKLSGAIVLGENKCAARSRTVLWMANCERALWDHALWCAEQALPIWKQSYPDDNRPQIAIETRRRHLDGRATDEELKTASAASAASASAAYAASAASASAASAASAAYAASAASASAAYAASASAAYAAAASAAYAAERTRQNEDLESRLLALMPRKRGRR